MRKLASGWPNTLESNLHGDLLAAQLVLDCGVLWVRLPIKLAFCRGRPPRHLYELLVEFLGG